LYEFPTSSNVSKVTSQSTLAKIPNQLLADLLLPTVLPRDTKGNKLIKKEALQIKSIQPVGDVVHSFSHIKKTYRAQWIILGGGETLPTLRLSDVEQPGKYDKKSTMEKLMDSGDDEVSASLLPMGAMWIKLKDVANAK
jgi:A/G-specific adenine glycosylase